jgi:DNA-binding transcriptional ArsR family regulator
MSAEALALVAVRFRALSEPSRLRLLIVLEGGERCVNDLVRETGLSQANVSRHLHALVNAGILARRKSGLQVFYRISDPSIFEMCDHVCGSISEHLAKQASILAG